MVLQRKRRLGGTDPDNRFADVALTADDIPNILNLSRYLRASVWTRQSISFRWAELRRDYFWRLEVLLRTGTSRMACRLDYRPLQRNHVPTQFHRRSEQRPGRPIHRTSGSIRTPLKLPSDNPAILTAPDPSIYNEWWQFGNMGLRNYAVRSPGFWNIDASHPKTSISPSRSISASGGRSTTP